MKKILLLLFIFAIFLGTSSCVLLLDGTICFVNQDVVDYDLYVDGFYQGTVQSFETYYYIEGFTPGDYYCEADEVLGVAYTDGWVYVSAGYTSYFYINEY